MCGICGVWELSEADAPSAAAFVRAGLEVLRPRGPDDSGVAAGGPGAPILGHRRLAILDLSVAGAQPMASRSDRYVLSYNGEIYNFRELRRELEGPWRGESDTEVLLAAIERWGLVPALGRVNGMFALALWDRCERRLHLARDRVGSKPLVWGRARGALLFASTLAAMQEHPHFDREIDRSALATYLRLSCIPAPHTVFRRAFKVLPGEVLSFEAPDAEPRRLRFWDARERALDAHHDVWRGTDDEALDALEHELQEAVRRRLGADVPVGAFLSGGIDSSSVVASMTRVSSGAAHTFAIGNTDLAYDEGPAAAAVARHLGTKHVTREVSAEDALRLVPELPTIADEPFADSSLLPTSLVCQLAREHATVALSGDGGDEVFGGYNRHVWSERVGHVLAWAPRRLRVLVGDTLRRVSTRTYDHLWSVASPPLPDLRLPGDKVHKLARVLGVKDAGALHLALQSAWHEPLQLLPDVQYEAERPSRSLSRLPLVEEMMLEDLVGYLPDDILTKVDRASMAVSLEVRVPLLDHRVLELAWRLPRRLKVEGGVGKRALRSVLRRHVPDSLVNRPKLGFGVPVGRWLRGPLRDWAEAHLTEERLSSTFDPRPIRRRWHDHLAGRGEHQHALWSVLMFQAWREASPTS